MKTYTKQDFLDDFDKIVETVIHSGEPVFIVENGVVVLELAPVNDNSDDTESNSYNTDKDNTSGENQDQ